MARQYQAQGKSVMLAAGDTFRAAAVEQLGSGRAQQYPGGGTAYRRGSGFGDFDAIQSAKAKEVDVLITQIFPQGVCRTKRT